MYTMYLAHHGIIGQKWGVRRYQNEDGTRTPEGKERRQKSVFISGSSKTQSSDSGYYRPNLPKQVTDTIDKFINEHKRILVGDAPGIDRQVQNYLNDKKYQKVSVYGPGKELRYLANEQWSKNPIDAPEFEPGSKEWLAKKDEVMTRDANEGFAVILDEGAAATRKNIERLASQGKKSIVFELSKNGSDYDKFVDYGKEVFERLNLKKS